MTELRKKSMTKGDKYLHLIRETWLVYEGEPVSAMKLFNEYTDFFGEPLHLTDFVAYIEKELIGIYTIKIEGLNYRINNLFI